MTRTRSKKPIRYAVVGLGHIAQTAVLPAFAHSKSNSRLVAMFSGDAKKRRLLSQRYHVDAYAYEDYENVLSSGDVDAVYICLPNHLHAEYTISAAKRGVHVLCEKPMAVDSRECAAMIAECAQHKVKLMIAYRLHFNDATLLAMRTGRSGRLGDLRFFYSAFSMQVRSPNIRIEKAKGGGPMHDIGIYCINAARMMFGAEPIEVVAIAFEGRDERFAEVNESISAILRFPEGRSAAFTVSFGATDSSIYEIVGTKGRLRVEPAYDYSEGLAHVLTKNGREKKRRFPKQDQFSAEITKFSNCILDSVEPEPSGTEGCNDVRIIEAIFESIWTSKCVALDLAPDKDARGQRAVRRAPVSKVTGVNVQSPSLE